MSRPVLGLLGSGAVLLTLAVWFITLAVIRRPGSKSRRLWTGLAVVVVVVALGLSGIRFYYDLTDLGQGILLGVGGMLLLNGIRSYFRPFVEVRPVSGATPHALLEIMNCGRAGEFYASANVLWAVGEGVMDFQDRTMRPPWLRTGTSDPLFLGNGQVENLVLATCSSTPWIGPDISKGVEWFRIKLEDGEAFSSLTQEKTEICIRVTVARKKSSTEFRQPRSHVADFIITGHPDWDLTIKPFNSASRPGGSPEPPAPG